MKAVSAESSASRSVANSLWLDRSQSLTVLSQLPVASVCPSGESAIAKTRDEWPESVASSESVLSSQSFTELSWLPETRVLPSRLIARQLTRLLWAWMTFCSWPDSASQTRMV